MKKIIVCAVMAMTTFSFTANAERGDIMLGVANPTISISPGNESVSATGFGLLVNYGLSSSTSVQATIYDVSREVLPTQYRMVGSEFVFKSGSYNRNPTFGGFAGAYVESMTVMNKSLASPIAEPAPYGLSASYAALGIILGVELGYTFGDYHLNYAYSIRGTDDYSQFFKYGNQFGTTQTISLSTKF